MWIKVVLLKYNHNSSGRPTHSISRFKTSCTICSLLWKNSIMPRNYRWKFVFPLLISIFESKVIVFFGWMKSTLSKCKKKKPTSILSEYLNNFSSSNYFFFSFLFFFGLKRKKKVFFCKFLCLKYKDLKRRRRRNKKEVKIKIRTCDDI